MRDDAEALAERFADACFDHADGPSWSTVYQNMLSLIEAINPGLSFTDPLPEAEKAV